MQVAFHRQKSWVVRPWTIGPSRKAGKNVSAATITIVKISSTTKVGVSVRNVPGPSGATRLRVSAPATASAATSGAKRPSEHRQPAEQVGERDAERADVAGRVGLHEAGVAGERRAVVVGLRDVGVERLREALRAGVVDRRRAVLRADRQRGRDQRRERDHQRPDHHELHLARLDLLAEVLRRATDHQTGDEDGQQDEQQHPVEPRADAAEDHLAGRHVEHRHQAADPGQRVEGGVDRAARRHRGDRP